VFLAPRQGVKARSTVKRIYLDHNATTRMHPEVRRAMAAASEELVGNPSSIHADGRAARQAVELARDQVARLIGASADEVVFTSGGTEGDNLAIRGGAEAMRAADPRRTRIVTSPLEHPAVVASVAELAARGFAVTRLTVDAEGSIDLDAFERALDDDVALVTVQLANHELGNLYPIAELAARAQRRGAWFHTDAVQAAGKLPIDVRALDVDLLTISAHKLYGPKGVGAVYLRRGRSLAPLVVGGHQERERRPGTENVAGAVGFGRAAQLVGEAGAARAIEVARLRDRLQAGALALGARLNGHPTARVGNTCNLGWDGVEGELVVINLDLAGVSASTGAACTSGSVEPSPVLRALGQSFQKAATGVRLSLGWDNTEDEIDRVLGLLPEIIERVRQLG
jgi:cysteine desulfurase